MAIIRRQVNVDDGLRRAGPRMLHTRIHIHTTPCKCICTCTSHTCTPLPAHDLTSACIPAHMHLSLNVHMPARVHAGTNLNVLLCVLGQPNLVGQVAATPADSCGVQNFKHGVTSCQCNSSLCIGICEQSQPILPRIPQHILASSFLAAEAMFAEQVICSRRHLCL